ncbi:uncharacterized protein LOC101746057 [Bombyx mori]|uniref:Serine protease gd N-terminal domain-containing protein n=1 Tax=Bombyx mori TaxID=7091 RepID=A0A8R2R315_BOMMO|nr:uncharacterized protein LOC101746057 isoform X2 [Bombyx mori]XP_037872220.1 uncharacterized protein LOC101746057 isoform X2 [Bombyx mori]
MIYFKAIFGVVSLVLAVATRTVQAPLTSPCPEYFTYETSPSTPDRWHGVLVLPPEMVEDYLWIYIALNRKIHVFGSDSGTTSTENFQEFLIDKKKYFNFDSAKSEETIRFVTSYDYAQPIPRVKIIRVNGREICRDNNTTQVGNEISFPTRPELPNMLLISKLNATGYTPEFLSIFQNSTSGVAR